MTSIDEHLDSYFSSLNPITRKIYNDLENVKKAYGEIEWDKLSPVQQEEVLARYMISDDVRDKYAMIEKENTPEVFPKLNINSGEKIVVDFENDDGWTWQDEHSGPFSWMSRSQQDLTLESLDNLDEQVKKTKRGKSHSPERDAGSKRQWDATYDKSKGTNAEAANTADEIFQKFGIAFSFGKDEEDNMYSDDKAAIPEDSELLSNEHDNANLYENINYAMEDDGNDSFEQQSGFGSSVKDDNLSDSYACSDMSSQWTSTTSSTSSKKKKDSGSKTRHSQKSEAELCLMDDPLDYNNSYGGQVSPVYIEELGESTTDPEPTESLNSSRFNYSDIDVQSNSPSVLGSESVSSEQTSARNSVVCVQPTTAYLPVPGTEDWQLNPDQQDTDIQTEQASSPKVTGFDFLDNW